MCRALPTRALAACPQGAAACAPGMPDETGGDWPAALAIVTAACDRVQSMRDSDVNAARSYARVVREWVAGLQQLGGVTALAQPKSVSTAGSALPASPPEWRQARKALAAR